MQRRLSTSVGLGFFALLPLAGAAGAMASPLLLGLAGVLRSTPSQVRNAIGRAPFAVWLTLADVAWAAISSFWSPFHNHGQAVRLVFTVLPGLLFVAAAGQDVGARRWTRAAGLASLLALMALLGMEALLNMPLNRAFDGALPTWMIERNPSRGATLMLAMLWAAVAALIASGGIWRTLLALGTLLVAGALSAQFHDTANLVALVLGLAAFALGYWLPALTPRLVAGVTAIWLLAAPFVTPLLSANQRLVDALPYSWAARVGIWRYVCSRILEHPIFGSGLDASRAVTDTILVRGHAIRAVQLHPHSGSLQIWFETGAIGALLAAAALLVAGWNLSRALAGDRARSAAVCATLATLALIANISYGIWQEWWDATIIVGAAMLAALRPKVTAG